MLKSLKKLIQKFYKNHYLFDSIFLFTISFSVYFHNLSPSVYGGDAGDFITAALTRGVPHPSGYPLMTILGIIFTSLPLNQSPAWKMGLISSIFSSLGVIVTYLIVVELTKKRFLAIITAFTLSFAYPYWLYAEIVEVFAMHNLFILMSIYFLLKYINSKKEKYIIILVFVLGLSLTNNQSILLIFPVIALIILLTNWRIIINFKLLGISFLVFLLALSLYAYIPIAASRNPDINWGQAVNLKNFLILVTRKDYKTTIPGFDKLSFSNNMKTYFIYLNSYVTIIPLLFAIPGLFYLLKKKKVKLFILFLLLYFFLGPFFIYAANSPLLNFGNLGVMERFYTSSIIILILLFPLGILLIYETASSFKNKFFTKILPKVIFVVFLIVPFSYFFSNIKKTDLHNNYIGENFAIDLLSKLPRNSVAFINDDTAAFNSQYMQYAYGYRKDIIIPGRNKELTLILEEAKMGDEERKKYTIKYRNMISTNLFFPNIPTLMEKGVNFYTDIDFSMEDTKYGSIVTIPCGLLFKIEFENKVPVDKKDYLNEVESQTDNYHIDYLKKDSFILSENIILNQIRRLYLRGFLNISKYFAEKYNDSQNSILYYKKAKEIENI